jgi:thiamine pyrophosphate-dependent acetolactate synthase large subunit-like protein
MPVWKVRKTSEFAGALKEMLAADGPAMLHVMLDIRDVSPFTGSAR